MGTAGATGTGITLTAPLTKAHSTPPSGASGVTVYGPTATDPTGDMTKVFTAGSTEWNEGKASQLANPGSAARNLAQTDFVGMTIHCAAEGGICNDNAANARPDNLPDEAGGYSGSFKALFGAKYVNPAINHGSACVDDTGGNPIQDQFHQCGFPGFDGMFARNTLGEVAQMQEAGSRSRSRTSPTPTTATASPARSTTPTGRAKRSTFSNSRTTTSPSASSSLA